MSRLKSVLLGDAEGAANLIPQQPSAVPARNVLTSKTARRIPKRKRSAQLARQLLQDKE